MMLIDAAFAEQYMLCPQVPDEVLHDAALNAAIAVLPANYNFEVRSSTGVCMYYCTLLYVCEAGGGHA